MKRLILLLLIAFCVDASASAQDQNEFQRKEREIQERLKVEFNSQPHVVRVSLFINDKEIPFDPEMRFSLIVDSTEVKPLSFDGSKFIFPKIANNFAVEFEARGYHFRFDGYAPHTVEDGAQMVFAVITDLRLLRTEPPFDEQADENYEKRSAYYEGRRNVSEERFVKSVRARRGVESVTFFVLASTVGGDGMAIITRQLNTKPWRVSQSKAIKDWHQCGTCWRLWRNGNRDVACSF